MNKRQAGTALLIFLGVVLFLASSSMGGKKKVENKKPSKVIYAFTEHLSEAEAERTSEGRKIFGKWIENRFVFGLEGTADIAKGQRTEADTDSRPLVLFPSGPGYDSTLVFPKVPIGRRLRIFYGVTADWKLGKVKALPVLFEVWIGNKRIFATQIRSAGWKEEVIDLTLPYLLQRKFRFSFKTRTLDTEWKYLVFHGYLE